MGFSDGMNTFLDWVAYSVAAASIFKLIPAVAGLMSIIWLGMQMYAWIKDRKEK